MLTKNIWQSKGLYNGALGTVRGILCRDGITPPSLPYCILVEFDEDHRLHETINLSLSFPKQLSLIHRVENREAVSSFHFVLGWAITVHKSQGLTLQRVVFGIGSREFYVGVSYVGCSHVRSYKGLALLHSFPRERMEKINGQTALSTR